MELLKQQHEETIKKTSTPEFLVLVNDAMLYFTYFSLGLGIGL